MINTFLKKYHSSYALKHKDDFKTFWIEKKLSRPEIKNIRRELKGMREEGATFDEKMDAVQERKRLAEDWKAERVVRTEDKKLETREVKRDAKKEGKRLFKIMRASSSCPYCNMVTRDGSRVFTDLELTAGGKSFPPFHPNCRCSLEQYEWKVEERYD